LIVKEDVVGKEELSRVFRVKTRNSKRNCKTKQPRKIWRRENLMGMRQQCKKCRRVVREAEETALLLICLDLCASVLLLLLLGSGRV